MQVAPLTMTSCKARFIRMTALFTGVFVLVVMLLAGWMLFWPFSVPPLSSTPNPVTDPLKARSQVATLLAEIPPTVRADCFALAFDHGHKTARVYVLLHGLTNCPAQFRALADILHADGANVLIPRLPYHGLKEGHDHYQKAMTAESMLEVAAIAVDLAHGYGEKITVIGLSVSGTTAAWLAQHRADVDTAMIIAPFFAPPKTRANWVVPLTRFIARLPNVLVWWDRGVRDALERPEHSYARFATHPLAHVMRMGIDLFHTAEGGTPPKARRIIMVTSEADAAISLPRVAELVALWNKSAPGLVENRIFEAELGVPHDAIDPKQKDAKIDIVYPQLLEWLHAE